MTDHDLDWVAAQRPDRRPTDATAHDRALLALLRHASSQPAPRRGRHGRWRMGGRAPRPLTLATTGVAAIVAALLAFAAGGKQGTAPALGIQTHTDGPALVRLAGNISASATPPGNATLVQRTTTLSAQAAGGPETVTVYDLYGDNGTSYFSLSESGMSAQVAAGNNQAGGLFAREIAAAQAAATGNVAQAALALANAPDTNGQPQITPTTGTSAADLASAKFKDKLTGFPYDPNATIYDNRVWENAQDALIAGAGNPEVRAGVLKILATLPGVTVTDGTSAGQPTLVLTGGSDEVGPDYQEQLTINAQTGTPISFVGGPPNGTPATQVSYKVARVTLSQVAAGTLPSFQ
jgi:hypothetical protein